MQLVRAKDDDVVAMMEHMENAGPIDWDAPIRWDTEWMRVDDRYMTGLAAKQGPPQLIHALHERGCNLEREPEVEGPPQLHQMFGTPLHEAASGFSRYSPERVQALLDYGCKAQTPDQFAGNTPLHCAVRSGTFSGIVWPDSMERLTYEGTVAGEREAVIRMLARAGCNVDAKNNVGRTPLEEAVDGRQWTAVAELLRMGADGRLVTPWKPLYVTRGPQPDRRHGAKDAGTYIEKILELDNPISPTTQRRDPTGKINRNNYMDYAEKRQAKHTLQVYKEEVVARPMEEYMMRAVMVKKLGGHLGRALGTGWCSAHRVIQPPDFFPPPQSRVKLCLMNILNSIVYGRPDGTRSMMKDLICSRTKKQKGEENQQPAETGLLQCNKIEDDAQLSCHDKDFQVHDDHFPQEEPRRHDQIASNDPYMMYLAFEYRPDYM